MYLIILICVLVVIWFTRVRDLSGFWVASEEFCRKAKLDKFIILLNKKGMRTYSSYILMVQNGETCINDPCVAKVEGLFKHTINFDVDIDGFEKKYEFDIKNGRLRLYKKNTLFGVFFLDAESTHLLKDS